MTKTAIELATERAAERPIAAKARGERFRARNPKLIVEFDAVLDPVPSTWEWGIVEPVLGRIVDPQVKSSRALCAAAAEELP